MPSQPPTFTAAEAAALLDWESKGLRKAIDGVVGEKPSQLPFSVLVYLKAERTSGLVLSLENKRKLYQCIVQGFAQEREPQFVKLNDVVQFQVRDIARETLTRVQRFRAWAKNVVSDPNIMGGAPVFKGSRLTLSRVAGLLERGEEKEVILEDYPDLRDEDLEFAPLYLKAFPKVGRPSRARQAAD